MKYLARLLTRYFKWKYENTKPDFIIKLEDDVEYLYRWWLIPRNKYFNIYLHKVIGDDERYFHDHPWNSLGFILEGAYLEVTPYEQQFHKLRNRKITQSAFHIETLSQGTWSYRDTSFAHYLTLQERVNHKIGPLCVWSLFFTGPKKTEWGFYDQQGNWEHHVKWHEDRGMEQSY